MKILLSKKNLYVLLLFALLLFHFWASTYKNFWYDEMASWSLIQGGGFFSILQRIIQWHEPFPPLYFFVLKVFSFFGSSENLLRMPSMIAGVLIVPYMYRLGSIVDSKELGFFSAIVSIIVWPRLYFSIEARPYELLLLTSILFAISYISLIDSRKSFSNKLIFFGAILQYIHFFGLVLVWISSAILLFRPKLWKNYFYLFLIYAPWMPVTIYHFVYAPSNQNIAFKGAFNATVENISAQFFQWDIGTSYLYWPISLLICGCIFVSSVLILLIDKSLKKILLVGWALIPLLLVILVSVLLNPISRPRYLIIIAPALILLLGILWSKIPFKKIRYLCLWLFLLLLGIQNIYNSSYLFSAFDREAKSAVEKVKESLALDQDLKLIVCSYDSDSVKYYFREAVEVLEKWPERFFCQKELLATVLESTEKRVLLWMFPFKGNEQAWLRGSTHRVEQRFEYSDSKLFILRKNRE